MKYVLTLCTLLGLVAMSLGQEEGRIWLQRISDAELVPHSIAEVEQTITTSGGSERTFTLRAWSAEDGELSLMLYTDPARVRGDKILQRDGGDNIWYYMDRRDVTRHFTGNARRQSAMGSDFSYEDLASGDMTEDYTAEFLGYEDIDGEDCVKLNCIPTESGPSYDHLLIWASRNDHLTRRIDYFDDDGLKKRLHISDIREIEGRTVAMHMLMENLREDSRTVMEYREITFEQEPEDWIFTQQALIREIPY